MSADRIVLVGQAPGPSTDPDFPLYPFPKNSAGGRLAALFDMSVPQYLKTFDRVNLHWQFPGKGSAGEDRFPLVTARNAAMAMRPLLSGRRVLVLGRGVANAFGLPPRLEPFTWHPVHCGHGAAYERGRLAHLALVPHTSGRSRWYNDPDNMARARSFLRGQLQKHACPMSASTP